jgi:uncharacterized membrane protein (GlpM family)
MAVEPYQLILRFVLGGSIVLFATLAADLSKSPFVAGVLMCFPAMVLAGAIALAISGYEPSFISRYFLSTLGGLAVVAIFSLACSFLVRGMGVWLGVLMGLVVWAVVAALVIFVERLVR